MDSKAASLFDYDSLKADVSTISAVLKCEREDYDDYQSDQSNDSETTEPPLEEPSGSGAGNDREDDLVIKPASESRVFDENFDVALRNSAELKDSIIKCLHKFHDLVGEVDRKQDYLMTKLEVATKLEYEEKKKIKYYKPINLFATPYFRDVKGSVPSPNQDSIMKRLNGDIDAYVAPPRPWTSPEHKMLQDAVIECARRQELEPLIASREYYRNKLKHGIISDEQAVDIETKLEIIVQEIESIRRKSDQELLQLDKPLDWMRIAASLPDINRTPDQCERMWCNFVHPSINKRKWTEEEDNELRKVAAKHHYRDWEQIAHELTLSKRTAIQCLQRYQSALNNKMLKSIWTPEDDEELLRVVEACRNGNYIPWNQVSYHIDGRKRLQIVNRWTRSIAPNLKKGPWSPEEDAVLLAAVDKYGFKWAKIKDLLPGRSNFSCRERYTNVLAPGVVVGNWTPDEDRLLVKLARQHPEGKWSKIAEHFDGRTDNMCLQRVTRIRKHHPHLFDPNTCFSDIEDDLETEELYTPTHNCKALNNNREKIRLAAEESLTKTIMKVRGYGTVEEAKEAIKTMKASRSFLFQLSRELLSQEGRNAHGSTAEKNVKRKYTRKKPYVRKGPLNYRPPRKGIKRPRQMPISDLSEETDSDTDTISFHDEDDDEEDFSERREETDEEIYAEQETPAVNHKRTEEDERVDAELDSLFLPMLLYGFRQQKKSKFVYQSARQVLEHKMVRSSLFNALQCVEQKASDEECESHEGTKIRGIDYAVSLPPVITNFVFDSSFQQDVPIFPPNRLSLEAFKFVLINNRQLLRTLSQTPCHTHTVSLISSQEIYTLVCASCYKTRNFESQPSVIVNVPDWTEENNGINSAESSTSDITLCNGTSTGSEGSLISCTECERLNLLRKDYHLLRKRLFSLFLWPALLTITEPNEQQKMYMRDQDVATKIYSKTLVKKSMAKRRRSVSRSRVKRTQSDTEPDTEDAVAPLQNMTEPSDEQEMDITSPDGSTKVNNKSVVQKCVANKRRRSRSRGRKAQSDTEPDTDNAVATLQNMVEPSDQQEISQNGITKVNNKSAVEKCVVEKRQRSRSRGRKAQSVMEKDAVATFQTITEQKDITSQDGITNENNKSPVQKYVVQKGQCSRSRGRKAQSDKEQGKASPNVAAKFPPSVKKEKCSPIKKEKVTKSESHQVASSHATRKSPRHHR